MKTPVISRRAALGTIALACLGCGISVLGACNFSSEQEDPQYDWDAVISDASGRKFYYPDGVLTSRVGIDVSSYDSTIDWGQVAQDGIEFAILRAGYRGYTEGGLYTDEQIAANLQGVQRVGMPFGIYFFSSAISEKEAEEEAEYTLEIIGTAKPNYPIVYDQEQVSYQAARANSLSREQYSANALAFCKVIEAAGFSPMVYGNQHHLALLNLDELSAYPVWYAEYGVERPTSSYEFTMWQYSSSGTVAGINSSVDMSIHFLADLRS